MNNTGIFTSMKAKFTSNEMKISFLFFSYVKFTF